MKEIQFIPQSKIVESTVPFPKPAKLFMPDWYKNIKMFENKTPKYNDTEINNLTVKSCASFNDALNFGYIQETWCDIYFEQDKNGKFKYVFSHEPLIFSHLDHVKTFEFDDNHLPEDFFWLRYWAPKVPSGYSVLITHPLNRMDLPFTVTSGVIDADVFYHTNPGRIPFQMKKNFNGIIPAGTPMFQIIPFKRDNWKTKNLNFDFYVQKYLNSKIRSKFYSSYRRYFHIKKYYE
jgi:hypothetical protein